MGLLVGFRLIKSFECVPNRAGSIKRSKLEKTDPSIHYEAFVEELDTGDSFTTSLVDILVKVSDIYWLYSP